MTSCRNTTDFSEVAKTTETINPQNLSEIAINSLKNDTTWLKWNRLDWEKWSIQEATNWLTQNWKNLDGRILIWLNNEWKIVIEDGRHLLEAYRQLWKEIPTNKISFRTKKAENLFKSLF